MEVKKIIWVINAQENPIKAFQNDNQRLWRSNSLAQELGKKGIFRIVGDPLSVIMKRNN